jgi:hypothetical protein
MVSIPSQTQMLEMLQERWYVGAVFTCAIIGVLLIRAASKRSDKSTTSFSGFELKVELDRAHRVILSPSDFGSAPPDTQSLSDADGQLRDSIPWTAALSRETLSDLVRTITANTGSVFFAQCLPIASPGEQNRVNFDPYMSASSSGEAQSALAEFEQRIVREFGQDAWKLLDSFDSATQCNRAQLVLQRVAWFLTIAPCLTVTMQTGLMPALFQPTFTIIISNPQGDTANEGLPVVRVMVDAFIGGPPLGPPNPMLKYTPLRLRMLSSDLAAVVVEGTTTTPDSESVSVQLPSISYAIRTTKSTRMLETVKASSDTLRGAVLEGVAWQTLVLA